MSYCYNSKQQHRLRNLPQPTATYRNLLQPIATYRNLLQPTATYRNLPQPTATYRVAETEELEVVDDVSDDVGVAEIFLGIVQFVLAVGARDLKHSKISRNFFYSHNTVILFVMEAAKKHRLF